MYCMLHLHIFSHKSIKIPTCFDSFLDHLQGISLIELFVNAHTWITLMLERSGDFSFLRNVQARVATDPVSCSVGTLDVSAEVKRPEHGVNHLAWCIFDLKFEWNHNSHPTLRLHGTHWDNVWLICVVERVSESFW